MAVKIGIGAMMGPGIFALPSEVAGSIGPLGIVAYLAMGLLTLFTALNYGELGAALPIAGGGYSFVSRTLPRPVAFLTGWFFWIGNTLACASYAVIFALTITPRSSRRTRSSRRPRGCCRAAHRGGKGVRRLSRPPSR